MAHFAELDNDNRVIRCILVDDSNCLDENGVEKEEVGIAFCNSLFPGRWIQTSITASFRKNFASVGYTYDEERDAFIPPRTFNMWLLDEETCQWVPPVPDPSNETSSWFWNDINGYWEEFTPPGI